MRLGSCTVTYSRQGSIELILDVVLFTTRLGATGVLFLASFPDPKRRRRSVLAVREYA